MAYDDLQIVVVFAKELCGSLGYEFMRSSVEAVFTDCVFLIVLFRTYMLSEAWSDGMRYQILLRSERPASVSCRH